MKNRSLAIVAALTITAALVAPTAFVAPAAASANLETTPAATSQVTAAATSQVTAAEASYVIFQDTIFLHGEISVTITPAKYATFKVKIYNGVGQLVSTLSYSGSSPYTLVKNDVYLGGNHTIVVSADVANAGQVYTNPHN